MNEIMYIIKPEDGYPKCIRFKSRNLAVGHAKRLAKEEGCIYQVEKWRDGEAISIMYINPIFLTINKERGQAMSAGTGRIYLEQTGADTFRIIRVRNCLGFKIGVELVREQVELMQEQGYDIDIRAAKVQDD